MAKELIISPQDFIEENRADFESVLNSDLDINNFIAAVTTALTMNPDVVAKCSKESVKKACIKAAYDGLRPDGKEAALVPFWNSKESTMEAQYMAMVLGVRKKARKHDDIIITAEVVYKNDHFVVVKGDEDRIEHTPAPMDEDPGPMIASYAIFKKGDLILHREVMRLSDIERVRAAAKSEKSPAWKNWEGEMAKKAAVNRGAKSVPMSDATRRVFDRDNDLYDVGQSARDVTPRAASLAGRFGGQKGAGFSSDNAKALPGQTMQMETIDAETREFVEAEVTQRSETSTKTAEAPAAPKIPRESFEAYSNTLIRFTSADSVVKGHDQFWESTGKPTPGSSDHAVAKAIMAAHLRRANGQSDIEKCKAEVAGILSEAFSL